jgi:hypothetical protein
MKHLEEVSIAMALLIKTLLIFILLTSSVYADAILYEKNTLPENVEIINKNSKNPRIIIEKNKQKYQYMLNIDKPFTDKEFADYIKKREAEIAYEQSDEAKIKRIDERLEEIKTIEAEKQELLNEKTNLTK